jgi:glycosyltransferase involved in cell wall biosynthesis
MVPVFNCSAYLEEALTSALSQAQGPEQMEMIVVDDASTDIDVGELVDRIGGGRIGYFRHPQNVGSVANFNSCIEMARGRHVHLLHADDRVLPGFYAAMEKVLVEHPEAGACFSRFRYMNDKGVPGGLSDLEAGSAGIVEGWLERIAVANAIQYASIVVRREVYERVGGFFGVTYGEDWEMWVRIASRYPIAYTPEVLAEYRIHAASISGPKLRSGENIRDLAWVIRTIQPYLPKESRRRAKKAAESFCARAALRMATRLWRRERDRQAANNQIREAIRLYLDPSLCWGIIKLYTEMAFDRRPARAVHQSLPRS